MAIRPASSSEAELKIWLPLFGQIIYWDPEAAESLWILKGEKSAWPERSSSSTDKELPPLELLELELLEFELELLELELLELELLELELLELELLELELLELELLELELLELELLELG